MSMLRKSGYTATALLFKEHPDAGFLGTFENKKKTGNASLFFKDFLLLFAFAPWRCDPVHAAVGN